MESFSNGKKKVPDAPIYHAKPEEMEDISILMANASSLAIRYGAVRIDPPPGWELPLLRMRSDSRFFVRMQAFPEAPFVSPSFFDSSSGGNRIKRSRTRRIADDDDDDDSDNDDDDDEDNDEGFTARQNNSKSTSTSAPNAQGPAANRTKRGPFSNELIVPRKSQDRRRPKTANNNATNGAGEIVLLDDLNPSSNNHIKPASSPPSMPPALSKSREQHPRIPSSVTPLSAPEIPGIARSFTHILPKPSTPLNQTLPSSQVEMEIVGVEQPKYMSNNGTRPAPATDSIPTLSHQVPCSVNAPERDEAMHSVPHKSSVPHAGMQVTGHLPTALRSYAVRSSQSSTASKTNMHQLEELATGTTIIPMPPKHPVASAQYGAGTPTFPHRPTIEGTIPSSHATPSSRRLHSPKSSLSLPHGPTLERPTPTLSKSASPSHVQPSDFPKQGSLTRTPAFPNGNERGYSHEQPLVGTSSEILSGQERISTKVDEVSISNLCSSSPNPSPIYCTPHKAHAATFDGQIPGSGLSSSLTARVSLPLMSTNCVKVPQTGVGQDDGSARGNRKRTHDEIHLDEASRLESDRTVHHGRGQATAGTPILNALLTSADPSISKKPRTTCEPQTPHSAPAQGDLVAELDSLPPVPRKIIPSLQSSSPDLSPTFDSEDHRKTFSRFYGGQKSKILGKRSEQKFSRMTRPILHGREVMDAHGRHESLQKQGSSNHWTAGQPASTTTMHCGNVGADMMVGVEYTTIRNSRPMEMNHLGNATTFEPDRTWKGDVDKFNVYAPSMHRGVSDGTMSTSVMKRDFKMVRDEKGNWHTEEKYTDGSSGTRDVFSQPAQKQNSGPRFSDFRNSNPVCVSRPSVTSTGTMNTRHARALEQGASAPVADIISKGNLVVTNADCTPSSSLQGGLSRAGGGPKFGNVSVVKKLPTLSTQRLDAKSLARKHFSKRVVEFVLERCIDQAVQRAELNSCKRASEKVTKESLEANDGSMGAGPSQDVAAIDGPEAETDVQEVCVRRLGRTRERKVKTEGSKAKKVIERRTEKRVTRKRTTEKRVNATNTLNYDQDSLGRLTQPVVFPDSAAPITFSSFKRNATSFFGRMQRRLGTSIRAVSKVDRKSESNDALLKRVDDVEREFFRALERGIDGEKFSVSYGVDVESEGAYDRSVNRYVEWHAPPQHARDIVKSQEVRRRESSDKSGTRTKSEACERSVGDNETEEEEIILEEGRADEIEECETQKESLEVDILKNKQGRSHVGNLNRSGVLRHLPLMPGINHTMFYVGQLFTRFCWHTEDAYLNSVSYLHDVSEGEKVWYAVPPKDADAFEKYAQSCVFSPELVANKDDAQLLFMNKTTIFNPANLLDHHIEVYRVVHKVGSFVLTAPRGYHAGFNCGFNVAEAVNFAHVPWFPVGRDAARFARSVSRPLCVPWEYLLFHEAKAIYETYKRSLPTNPSDRSRVQKDARIVALELRDLLARGEELIRAYVGRTNCRVTMVKDAEMLVEESQLGPEFGIGAGLTCSHCNHACHFFAEVCGSCEANPNAKCMLHFGSVGRKVCYLSGHKGIIVRRHDPLRLLDILEFLERIGSVEVSIEERYKRFRGFVRTWNTPMRKTCNLRLKLSLVTAASRIPPNTTDEKNEVENVVRKEKTSKKRLKREPELSSERDRKKVKKEKQPVKRISDDDDGVLMVVPTSTKRKSEEGPSSRKTRGSRSTRSE